MILVEIIIAVILILFIICVMLGFVAGENGQNLAYIDHNNGGVLEEFNGEGSFKADKNKISSANLACLAYYEALADKTVLQEAKDDKGNVIYIPYTDQRAKHDKFERDKDFRLDYNILYALNNRVFGDKYVYPEAFLNPVAHDKDYKLCAVRDENGEANTSFTEVYEPDDTEATTEERNASEEKKTVTDSDLVIVKDYIPDISINLAYATADNFVGMVVYSDNTCYLRYGTVKKLMKAQEQLKKDGYGGFMIWDGYRPQAAVDTLYAAYPDKKYVAQRSNHTRGNTVDLTIVDTSGNPIEMPSQFDEFSTLADTNYSDVSKKAGENATYLTNIMTANGFTGYESEWWHFADTVQYDFQDSLTSTSAGGVSDTSNTVSAGGLTTATASIDEVGISTLCSYREATSSTYLKGTYVSKVLVNAETGVEKTEVLDEAVSYNIPIRSETFDVLDKTVSMWESVTYKYNDMESCVGVCTEGRSANEADNVNQIQKEDEVRTEEVEETVTKYPLVDKNGNIKEEFNSEADANKYLAEHKDSGLTLGTPYEKTEKVKKEVTYHVYYVRGEGSGKYQTSCVPAGSDKETYDNAYLYDYLSVLTVEVPNVERDYDTFRKFSSYAGQGAFLNAVSTNYGADGKVSAKDYQQKFIDLIGPLCIEEAQHTGIYPSLMMAQFILESGWGGSSFENESEWSRESNLGKNYYNYVGMTSSPKSDGKVITFWDDSTWIRRSYQGGDRYWADFSTCESREAGTIACIRYYGYNFWVSGYYDDCGALNHVSAGLSAEEAKADALKQLAEYASIYAPESDGNAGYTENIERLINDYNLWSLDETFLSEGGFDGTRPYEKNSSSGNNSGIADTVTSQVGNLSEEDAKTFSEFFHAVDKETLEKIDKLTYTHYEVRLGVSDVDDVLREANRFTYGLSVKDEQLEFEHDDLLNMSLLLKDRKNGLSGEGFVTGDWVFYKQYEGPWASQMYGTNTYAASGCGPTSLAMCIASLIDPTVTPDVVGAALIEAGYRVPGEGTRNGYCKAVADKFGYYCEVYDVNESGVKEKVDECLRSGGVVCWSSGAQPFTANAHCMALRGITDDGKWLVADPNDNASKNHNQTEFDPEFITSRWHCDAELIWVSKP